MLVTATLSLLCGVVLQNVYSFVRLRVHVSICFFVVIPAVVLCTYVFFDLCSAFSARISPLHRGSAIAKVEKLT